MNNYLQSQMLGYPDYNSIMSACKISIMIYIPLHYDTIKE